MSAGCSNIWENLLKSLIHEEASRCSSLDVKIRFCFGTQHEILRIVDGDGVGEDAHKKEIRTMWAKETERWIGQIIGRMNRSGGAVALANVGVQNEMEVLTK